MSSPPHQHRTIPIYTYPVKLLTCFPCPHYLILASAVVIPLLTLPYLPQACPFWFSLLPGCCHLITDACTGFPGSLSQFCVHASLRAPARVLLHCTVHYLVNARPGVAVHSLTENSPSVPAQLCLQIAYLLYKSVWAPLCDIKMSQVTGGEDINTRRYCSPTW